MTLREIRATAAKGNEQSQVLDPEPGPRVLVGEPARFPTQPAARAGLSALNAEEDRAADDDPDAEECHPSALRKEQDEEGGDEREGRERPEVRERKDAGDGPGECKTTPVPILHAHEQHGQDQEHKRNAVQGRPLRHDQREVRVEPPEVRFLLGGGVPGVRRQRLQRAPVGRVEQQHPSEAAAEHEEDECKRRHRAIAGQAQPECIEPDHEQRREHEALDWQGHRGVQPDCHHPRRCERRQVVVGKGSAGEARMGWGEVVAIGERGRVAQMDGPIAPDVLMTSPEAVRFEAERSRPQQPEPHDEEGDDQAR